MCGIQHMCSCTLVQHAGVEKRSCQHATAAPHHTAALVCFHCSWGEQCTRAQQHSISCTSISQLRCLHRPALLTMLVGPGRPQQAAVLWDGIHGRRLPWARHIHGLAGGQQRVDVGGVGAAGVHPAGGGKHPGRPMEHRVQHAVAGKHSSIAAGSAAEGGKVKGLMRCAPMSPVLL